MYAMSSQKINPVDWERWQKALDSARKELKGPMTGCEASEAQEFEESLPDESRSSFRRLSLYRRILYARAAWILRNE